MHTLQKIKMSETDTTDAFDNDSEKAWGSSDARAALYAAITEGEIPLERGQTVEKEDLIWDFFCLRPEVYNYGEFERFRGRLNSLRAIIKAGKSRAEEDLIAYQQFIKNHPKSTMAANGDYPEWEGHKAQELLVQDMADGKHEEMTPMQLRQTRAEYREFPLDVFRSHIYQDIRTEKWLKYLKKARKGDAWKEFIADNEDD